MIRMIGNKYKNGFTLTEVLLAVMIVGLIGVALASLARSAARESGVGRSKIILRNNLASFMRTLRNDLGQATIVSVLEGDVSSTTPVPVLYIAQNVSAINPSGLLQNRILTGDSSSGNNKVTAFSLEKKYIFYCFARGTDNESISPESAYRGGVISRAEGTDESFPSCETAVPILENVKYIPAEDEINYPVPLFAKDAKFSREGAPDVLSVKIIVEVKSNPIVNEVVEENFSGPMGY